MLKEEKNLIINLFKRLKIAEKNSFLRDLEAENIIKELVKKQPLSLYYMVQTIVVNESALLSMNKKIKELKNNIIEIKKEKKNLNNGFISNLIENFNKKKNIKTEDLNETTKKNQNFQKISSSNNDSLNPINFARKGSFLNGALQTAAGVAGGMLIGNILNNIFHSNSVSDNINIINNDISSLKDNNLMTEDNNLMTEDNNLMTEDNNLMTEDNNLMTEDNNLMTEDNNLMTEDNNLLYNNENSFSENEFFNEDNDLF